MKFIAFNKRIIFRLQSNNVLNPLKFIKNHNFIDIVINSDYAALSLLREIGIGDFN